ncbi:hypothetical protein Pint_33521 [Pistacia integerrima]|uniref:Uncharacterized protein n=1 Tax=Pistacia integerrima TaxID=434235 RepID=A0ACC0X6Q7_9ROSI|nr:hypothetical protein Pint_33521 [Pistacia integerrima]
MGFNLNLLKTSPISSRKSFLFTTTTKPTITHFSLLIHSPPTTRLTSSCSLKPAARCISSSGFSGSLLFHHSKRSFRGGVVVAMAASGSVQKSEEEWRAVLSPEQFRILRQKGTDVSYEDEVCRSHDIDVSWEPDL